MSAVVPAQTAPLPSAIGLLLLAMAGFAVSDALAKQLAPQLGVVNLIWFRYATLTLCISPILWRWPRVLRSRRPVSQVGRCLGMLAAAVLFVSALQRMPLAEATAIAFASPTFTTLLSVLVLKERVDGVGWGVVLTGLIGVLVVMQPGTAAFQPAGFLSLASALAWAISVLFTRRAAETDGVGTTMSYSALLGLMLTTVAAVPSLRWPTMAEWPLLASMACVWCAAHWLAAAAYQRMSAAVLAPFAYTQLLFAALIGWLAFGHWPTATAALGMGIILACGLLAAWRSRR